MMTRICIVIIFLSSMFSSQRGKDKCEELFSERYELICVGELVFNINDSIRAVQSGMKTFLFNVKFHYVNRCEFLNEEKAFNDIDQLIKFLHKNDKVTVQLVIYNWWLSPESSYLLNGQIEKIEFLLKKGGVAENRFEVIISRDGYNMFPSNDSLVNAGTCEGGLPPITYLNSWLDVVVVKI